MISRLRRMPRWGGLLGILLLWGLLAAGMARAADGLVPVPAWTASVMDLTDTLSPEQLRALRAKAQDLETATGAQLYVLIVPSTGEESVEQYARRVFDDWRIGRKGVDDGVLLLVAKDDRSLRIDTGYGLEGAITDLQAGRIIREQITPHFTFGDFYAGVDAGVDAVAALVRGEPLPPPATEDDEPLFMLAPFAFFALVVPPVAAAIVAGVLVYVIAGQIWLALLGAVAGFALSLLGRSMGMGRRFGRRRRRGSGDDDDGFGGFGGFGGGGRGRGGGGGGGFGGGGGGRGGGGGASGRW